MKPIIMETQFSNVSKYILGQTVCEKKPGNIYGSYKNTIMNTNEALYQNEQRESVLKHFSKGNGGFLYGNAGIGKTTIMRNLAKKFVSQGKHIYFELANNISVTLKEYENKEAKMRLLQTVDILFIDDFAREVMTSWVILNIFNPIIQHRIDNNKPIFISCNYSLMDLFKIIEEKTDYETADAIISRLKTLGTFNLKDKNYRLEKGEEKK